MTHLFSIPTLPNSSVPPYGSLRFDHLHEPGYKNPKLYKQPDCRSGACYTRYRHRGIQKLVTRTSPWLACSNFWQVRRTTRQDVESNALIIYSSLNRVITEALKNRIGNPWLYYN
jgi:hypothetical protein